MKTSSQIQKEFAKIQRAERGLNFIIALKKQFPKAQIYLVGGMARDLFLGRESKDYDFVVCGVPAKKLEAALKKLGATNLVGKRFGVFKFAPKNSNLTLDVALPRTEHAWGTGGYRDVETQSDSKLPIEADLARRDFTINAIALELSAISNRQSAIRSIIDPYSGLMDLKDKTIRTVGKPQERFKEDYSRMLRGLRFAAQLSVVSDRQSAIGYRRSATGGRRSAGGDWTIEKQTWTMLVKMMKKINSLDNQKERIVPYEVISKEFIKSLVTNPLKTLDMWEAAGATKQLIPELLKMKGCPQPPEFHAEGDVWTHTRLALRNLFGLKFKKFVKSLPPAFQAEPLVSPTLAVAVLFHDLGKPYTIKIPGKDNVDRIRTNEHDTVGARLARQIGERLRLSSVPDLHCDLDHLSWLIQHHLLTVHGDPMKFTNRTIERYFFNPLLPGGDLLKLIYCDQMASYVRGKPQLGSLPRLIKRVNGLLSKQPRKNKLAPPLLNGHEIIKILKLKPGRLVGDIKNRLREAQLGGKIKNKKEAKQYLKRCEKLQN